MVVAEGKARGGIARAKRLSPEEKSQIAQKAAVARWDVDLAQAICGSPDRPLRIGDKEIPCYVLADGTRVLSQAGFLEALGRHRKANVRKEELEEGEVRVPPVLQGKAIRPFISQDVLERSYPITFRTPQGVRASGYRAELLADICNIYVAAKAAGVLPKNQEHVAAQAAILHSGFSHVGIIGLVDEATGYQDVRAKDALAKILEDFIDKKLHPWLSTFSADFYRELFRLRGLEYPKAKDSIKDSIKRPQYFGILTNDIVYKRLAPGVLDELKRVTPRTESGRLKHKYFQRLTQNVGYPQLREHLGSVVAIMKLSKGWDDFQEKLNQLHPRYGEQLPLFALYDPEQDDGKGL